MQRRKRDRDEPPQRKRAKEDRDLGGAARLYGEQRDENNTVSGMT